jgi:hypothetical protein
MHVLFMVGAGAVSGAWQPVIKALGETHYPEVHTSDGANYAMAQMVYVARLRWRLAPNDSETKAMLRRFREVRERIACELRDAEARGGLSARPEFEGVARTFALELGNHVGKVSTVTTNWDGTVATEMKKIGRREGRQGFTATPVHGTSADPRTLYLPTEVVGEPYREPDEENKMGGIHVSLLASAQKTDRIVLYGLSMSPLDAELGAMIGAGLSSGNLSEIYVINPWYTEVADRLNVLRAPDKHIPIRCYHPTDLQREWTYRGVALAEEHDRLKKLNFA